MMFFCWNWDVISTFQVFPSSKPPTSHDNPPQKNKIAGYHRAIMMAGTLTIPMVLLWSYNPPERYSHNGPMIIPQKQWYYPDQIIKEASFIKKQFPYNVYIYNII